MNPRAAINDLHPFQGCPFGQLGYFSTLLLRIRNSRIDYSKPSLLLQHFFCICLSLFKYTGTVQTCCHEVPGSTANIIFIEKHCRNSLSELFLTYIRNQPDLLRLQVLTAITHGSESESYCPWL